MTDDEVMAARVVAWIEEHIGGRVAAIERQPRWRPAWFVDVERDEESVPLYVRGDRGSAYGAVYTLEHEYRILRVLESEGIPVPHVYGLCPDPLAIVMARAPGRANLSTADDDDERRAVLDEYIDILVAMHDIDVGRFEAEGVEVPRDAEQLALVCFNRFEQQFRADQSAPDPLVDFLVGWVRRNVPRHRRRPSFVHCDSGQFLFEGGHLTAVLDFDVAHVGDPLVDLASLRLRDLAEPLGDIRRALRRYEELTGEPIDRDALDFHTVQWSLCTPLSTARIVNNPPPDSDPILYLEWYLSFARVPLEVIGRRLGLELPAIEPPPPRPTRRGWANAALVDTLGALSVEDEFDGYRLDVARRLARYLALADAQGPALDEEERDDVAELAGRVPLDAADAERAVMEVVHSSGPGRDGELTAFFHRQVLRQLVLVGPVSSRSGDQVMQDIDG